MTDDLQMDIILWRTVCYQLRNPPHCHSWGGRPRPATDDLQMDISGEQYANK